MKMRLAYNMGLILMGLLGLPYIIYKIITSAKRRKTVLQRLWLPAFSPPKSVFSSNFRGEKPIWVHALSVGEALSAVPLIKGLRESCRQKKIVFSFSTHSGFEIANRNLKAYVDNLVYFPYDLLFSVKQALNTINPACIVIIESDVWPNFLFEVKNKNIPTFFVNARLSDSSFKGYKQFSFFSKPLFSAFTKICAQSAEDAERFKQIGIPNDKILVTGNIKFDQLCDDIGPDELQAIKQRLNIKSERHTLIAGSTHENEESILLDAFKNMKKDFQELLLIVAPRDPARSKNIQSLFQNSGFSTLLMQEISDDEADNVQKVFIDVIIIDRIGMLRKLYAVADIAFIGGSLVNLGGHNPLEPAVFSKPVLFGSHMSNFKEISRKMLDHGGALIVPDAPGLHQTTTMLLKDREKARMIGRQAFNVFHSNQGAVEKTLRIIKNNCI